MKNIYLITLLLFLSYIESIGQTLQQNLQRKEGKASYYHAKFNGRKTATGEIFSNENMTAASNVFPLGTMVKVTNKSTGKYVYVRINDRMAPNNPRVIDLTARAARELCFIDQGLCTVIVEKADGDKKEIILKKSAPDTTSTDR